MSKRLDENTGIAPHYASMPPASSTSWRGVTPDSDGLLNLTRAYGKAQTGHAIIGKQVFASKNLWDIPGASKNPGGRLSLLNESFALPLRKGKNEIAVMLDDNFAGGLQHFGWGLETRLNNLKHMTWKAGTAHHSM